MLIALRVDAPITNPQPLLHLLLLALLNDQSPAENLRHCSPSRYGMSER